ncbi:glycosyltransferase [Hydrogenophaga sp. ZJX-1]|uniref:glycosyltransferase n=1 Tax=Hydrogenophaga sp. ZJX-1 TaxID=3404778 RepID=UPI003B28A61C
MKIVHILTRLLKAGSEENTLSTCKAQIAAGHEVYLVHGQDFDRSYYDNPISGLRLVGIKEFIHPISVASDFKAYRALTRFLESLHPDVVHTHQSKAGIVGRFAAHSAKVPLVIHGVHIVPFANVGTAQRLLFTLAEKAAAKITHAFINVSHGTRSLYLDAGIGDASRHHVVHSGFDLERFRNASIPDDWHQMLRLEPGAAKPPVVLMLAALEPRKRHCEFIEAFASLVREQPDIRLVLAGEGPHRQQVQETIEKFGLDQNVLLLGYRNDPEKLIALADLCVLTSTREGLPRVIMQYIAGGKPCITTHLPGVEEVVSHSFNGLIVPPDGLAESVTSIAELLKNKERLLALCDGARSTDLSSWEARTMCRRIDDIYLSYLSQVTPHAA